MSKFIEILDTPTNYEYKFQFNYRELLYLQMLVAGEKTKARLNKNDDVFNTTRWISKSLSEGLKKATYAENRRKEGREQIKS